MEGQPVDIIVPVYRGLEETLSCLESVVNNPQRHPYRLVIINDASPDPGMAPMLEAFAAGHDHVELHHNTGNLGFVGTVNRGMALHPESDVVLLNSDTEVANDWLDRLLQAAGRNPDAATLTPFSNNATICSFPRFCHFNPLPAHWPLAELDRLFAESNAGEVLEVPTGVGFCMYIRRASLDAVGFFDEERFGRGYGEENDFCRRAEKAGWRNLLCCDTFVYHRGGVSFSSEQEARIERAQQILDRLHPEYHALVQQHIQQDPAAIHRFRVLLEMYRRSPRHKVLHVTHRLGGGTLTHVRELAEYLQDDMDSLLLQPGDDSGRTSLHFGVDPGDPSLHFQLPADYPDLVQLLRQLGLSRLHFHHTLGLETSAWGLPRDLEIPFDITIHDYYFINAHPTQTDAQGRYQPDLEKQQGSYPLPVPLETWQRNQRHLLDHADRVIAPSAAAFHELERYFPGLTPTIAFHPDSERAMPWPGVVARKEPGEPLKVLVLGALSPEKGADLLEATALAARRAGAAIEFHLLGYAYRELDPCVANHGAYTTEELPGRIAEIAPHLAWFPALWPETYSYTLSEALQAGLPVVVPDLGAFPERVRHRPLTWIEPWQKPPLDRVRFFSGIAAELERQSGRTLAWETQPRVPAGGDFYRRRYLADTPRVHATAPVDAVLLGRIVPRSRLLQDREQQRLFREALLRHLLIIRQGPLGRMLSRVVPVNIQRRIKRSLSRKPVHELEK